MCWCRDHLYYPSPVTTDSRWCRWCRQVSVLVLLPAVVLTAAIRSLHQGPLLLHGSLMAALMVRCIMVIATSVVLNIAQLTGVGWGQYHTTDRGRRGSTSHSWQR